MHVRGLRGPIAMAGIDLRDPILDAYRQPGVLFGTREYRALIFKIA